MCCFNDNPQNSAWAASFTCGRNYGRFQKHMIHSQKSYPGNLLQQIKDQKHFQRSVAMARFSIMKASEHLLLSHLLLCLHPPRLYSQCLIAALFTLDAICLGFSPLYQILKTNKARNFKFLYFQYRIWNVTNIINISRIQD